MFMYINLVASERCAWNRVRRVVYWYMYISAAAAEVRAKLTMEEATLQEILESTVAVARGLEALQSEHETVLTDFYATEDLDSTEAGT